VVAVCVLTFVPLGLTVLARGAGRSPIDGGRGRRPAGS
jgi:hypothetical protein